MFFSDVGGNLWLQAAGVVNTDTVVWLARPSL